jgi:hypothetical protein
MKASWCRRFFRSVRPEVNRNLHQIFRHLIYTDTPETTFAAHEKGADQVDSFRAGIMDLLVVTVTVQTDTESLATSRAQPSRFEATCRGEETSLRVTAGHWQEYENPSI